MSEVKVEKGAGGWMVHIMSGTLYENTANVMDVLDQGNGKDAKVSEGSDSDGNTHSFVFIRE